MAGFSRLRPETSVLVGALTAIGVVMIYSNSVPNLTEIHAATQHDHQVESNRKKAAIESVVLVVGVSLIARDLSAYVIGGAVLVGMDYLVKHNNATNPSTGKLDTEDGTNLYAVPNYETDQGTIEAG